MRVQLTSFASQVHSESGPITVAELPERGVDLHLVPVNAYYLHIPLCFHKCHYCDFYSIVDSQDRQGPFTDRLIDELRAAAALGHFQPAQTIFVGGGTPTLLAPSHWQRLLDAMQQTLRPGAATEFTVEANPETVTAELAATLAAGGVNRVSIGAQSFNPKHLKTLERWHDPANVSRSVALLRDAGIDAMNLDLIFAIPGQSLEDWLDDLDRALALEPTHISCYSLTYEPNTPMTVKLKQGRFQPAAQDLEAEMYEATAQRLAEAGFEHYEISAWARPGHRCRHNLRYWSNSNWWPLGPSASGHVNGVRWKNLPRFGTYLESHGLPQIVDVEQVDADARIGETLMLRMRLLDGIAEQELDDLLQQTQRGSERRQAIDRHFRAGLLETAAGYVRLTQRGLLFADSVIADLL